VEKKIRPQLIRKKDGVVTIASVRFGEGKPQVLWPLKPIEFTGACQEEVLNKIDELRRQIAQQQPLMPGDYRLMTPRRR
jgi:hypothetical protein